MTLIDDLSRKILVADGAMGTILYSHGVDKAFEELNLTHPELIAGVHESYIEAGADVIQTNTYGANFIKLNRYGLQDEVKKINKKAVEIAKSTARGRVHVIGNIGGIHGGSHDVATETEWKRSFREQLYCLLLEGVDGLILETYYDIHELRTVLEIARDETDIPIITNVSMHEPGVMENGESLDTVLKSLENIGADVVGVNCRLGPAQMVTALKEVHLPNKAYLAAYPNASLPAYRDGILFYKDEPDYFEKAAHALRDEGVRLIGGCCGTTPAHIKAVKKGVENLQPLLEKVVPEKQTIAVKPRKVKEEKTIPELAKEGPTIIVELDAPKHLDLTEYFEGAEALHDAGADAITLSDNSLATPRISNVAVATKLKEKGIRPLVHLTCRDHNLIGLQAHLMGLHVLELNEILAITGDPTKIGDFPGATSVFDLNSFKLIERIKKGNAGLSFSGKSLREETTFSVAAAHNPNVASVERSIRRLEKKIESGADYILTQPMFDSQIIRDLGEATTHIEVPIFAGIMPLTSSTNAEFLHNEVPGIRLSDEVRAQMQSVAGDREKSTAKSIKISKALIDTALEYFNGIYLVTPFMRYDITVELVKYIHEKTAKKQLVKVQ